MGDLLTQRDCEGVYLMFVSSHSQLLSKLSVNVLREVHSYFSPCSLLVIAKINTNLVFLYELETGLQTGVICSQDFAAGLSYCSTRYSSLFCVGGVSEEAKAKTVDLRTGQVTAEQDMCEGRLWPGIIDWSLHAYVFGGKTNNLLHSSEKFVYSTRSWTRLPDMQTPKACFTPCSYQGLVYLPAVDQTERSMEVFSSVSERFWLTPLRLSSQFLGCLAFVTSGELVILSYEQKAYSWLVGSSQTRPLLLGMKIGQKEDCFTNSPPVRCREDFYWANGKSQPIKFDWKEHKIMEMEGSRLA